MKEGASTMIMYWSPQWNGFWHQAKGNLHCDHEHYSSWSLHQLDCHYLWHHCWQAQPSGPCTPVPSPVPTLQHTHGWNFEQGVTIWYETQLEWSMNWKQLTMCGPSSCQGGHLHWSGGASQKPISQVSIFTTKLIDVLMPSSPGVAWTAPRLTSSLTQFPNKAKIMSKHWLVSSNAWICYQ